MRIRLLAGRICKPALAGVTDAYLDLWEVPEGAISIPALMTRDLIAIRTEHAAWAYDMAKVNVGPGTLADVLRCGSNLSMWWCSLLYERHPKVTPALYDVYRLRELELVMDKEGCTDLAVYGCTERVAKALKYLCKTTGRSFAAEESIADSTGKSTLRRTYEATPAPLRALVRFAHWLCTIKRKLPRTKLAPSDAPTGTIATYFPNIDVKLAAQGRFRSRYWESLHDALKKDAGESKPSAVRWLMIRFPSPQGSLAQCRAWLDDFAKEGQDGVSFSYLEEFLGFSDMASCLGRWLRLATSAARVRSAAQEHFHFKGSRLNLWPLLGDDYTESFLGWRSLERCLQQRGIENYVREAGQQRWYSFPLENCPWERMLTHAVHEAHTGPVRGAQHSTIRPTDFRYFDDVRTWKDPETLQFQPDSVAGNGTSACTQWQDAGVPNDRLRAVEALRYLYLADLAGKTPEAPSGLRRLLVVTSFFADETEAHIRLLADAVKAGLMDGREITVKPHPYLPVEGMLKDFLGEKAAAIRVSSTPLPQEFADAPLVWASNSTTAALEAAIRGLPVMVMQPVGDFDLCPLQDVPELVRTSGVESVREGLAKTCPLTLDPGYLCLDPALPRWKEFLDLKG